MKFMDSLKEQEQDAIATTPNAISAGRALAGLALFGLLARNKIDPKIAVTASAVAAVSDFEGSLVRLTNNYPRAQKWLRLIPSKFGRKLDPIADKVFGVGVLAGGLIGGQIPKLPGSAILATELITAGVSATAEVMGKDPEVSKGGKVGLGLRFTSITSYLIANAVDRSCLLYTSDAADE